MLSSAQKDLLLLICFGKNYFFFQANSGTITVQSEEYLPLDESPVRICSPLKNWLSFIVIFQSNPPSKLPSACANVKIFLHKYHPILYLVVSFLITYWMVFLQKFKTQILQLFKESKLQLAPETARNDLKWQNNPNSYLFLRSE